MKERHYNGHPKCRPPHHLEGVQRFNSLSGRWARDNGDPAHVFISDIDGDNTTVWVAICRCKVYAECPVARAMSYAIDRGAGSVTVIRKRASPTSRTRRKVPR